MHEPLHLLLLDTSPDTLERLIDELRRRGLSISHRRLSRQGDLDAALEAKPQLLLWNAEAPPMPLPRLRQKLEQLRRPLPLIGVSADYNRHMALQWLTQGCDDVVAGHEYDHLARSISRQIEIAFNQELNLQQDAAMQECESRFDTLLEAVGDAIAFVHQGVLALCNRAFLQLLGFSDYDSLSDTPLLDLVDVEDQAALKAFLAAGNGSDQATFLWHRADGTSLRLVATRHLTTLEGEEMVLLRLTGAEHAGVGSEDLEGAFFNSLAEQYRDGAPRAGWLALIELNDYAPLRERLGLAGVRQLMQAVAEHFRSLHDHSRLLPLGGDSLLLFQPQGEAKEALLLLDQRRQNLCDSILTIAGRRISPSLRIGVCNLAAAEDWTGLLGQVEAALHACDEAQPVHLYDSRRDRHHAAATDQQWQQRLEQALQEDHFQLAYLPIVALHASPAPAYEVLLRYVDEQGETVPAAKFIHAARQSGLSTAIDRWVLSAAIAQLGQQPSALRLFVNLSAASLADGGFLDWLLSQLAEAHVAPGRLVLELGADDALVSLAETRAFLSQCRRIGLEVAVQHYGGGADSEVLAGLPVDYLKLDGQLVTDLANRRLEQVTVQELVEKARKEGKYTIAPFVQNADSLAKLWGYGVNYIQGYYLRNPSDRLDYDFGNLRK